MNPITKGYRVFRLFKALASLARNPYNPEYVFDISDACNRLNMYGLSKKILLADPEAKQSIEQMWLLPKIDLNELRKLPAGSFGRAYAEHMIEHGYDPEFWRKSDIHNDITYITVRMRQTHDMWHIMTEFDVSVEGEIGLQAFVLAQTGLPIAMLLVGGGIFRACLKEISQMPKMMEAVTQGWNMGKKAKSLFPIVWEQIWGQSLVELRARYKIEIPDTINQGAI